VHSPGPVVIQQMPTSCVQDNDNDLEVLPHVILYLSTRRPQIIWSRSHIRNGFLKFRIPYNSVSEDQELFSKIDQKTSKKIRRTAPSYPSLRGCAEGMVANQNVVLIP